MLYTVHVRWASQSHLSIASETHKLCRLLVCLLISHVEPLAFLVFPLVKNRSPDRVSRLWLAIWRAELDRGWSVGKCTLLTLELCTARELFNTFCCVPATVSLFCCLLLSTAVYLLCSLWDTVRYYYEYIICWVFLVHWHDTLLFSICFIEELQGYVTLLCAPEAIAQHFYVSPVKLS